VGGQVMLQEQVEHCFEYGLGVAVSPSLGALTGGVCVELHRSKLCHWSPRRWSMSKSMIDKTVPKWH
jgi:hypothetical protein